MPWHPQRNDKYPVPNPIPTSIPITNYPKLRCRNANPIPITILTYHHPTLTHNIALHSHPSNELQVTNPNCPLARKLPHQIVTSLSSKFR